MEKTGGLYSPWGHKELVTTDHFFLNLALYHMLICKNCQNRSCHDPFIESTSSLMCSYMCLSEYFYRIFKQRHLFILTENFNLVKSFLPFFFFLVPFPSLFHRCPGRIYSFSLQPAQTGAYYPRWQISWYIFNLKIYYMELFLLFLSYHYKMAASLHVFKT